MKEKLMIAGANGFVGRNMVELLHESYQIVAVDKTIDSTFFDSFPDTLFRELDMTDLASVKELVETNLPDYVINLISVVSAARDLSMFPSLIETNLSVLLTLFEALKEFKDLKLFVQFGSAEEYGSSCPVPFEERSREYPDSPYALIKQLTSNSALMLHRNYGFPAMVVRPSNLYGKYQPKDKVIPFIVDKLVKGHVLELTPGKQKRDFLYCHDLVQAINVILKNVDNAVGRMLNVGSGVSVSIKKIVEIIQKLTNSDSTIRYGALSYRKNEMMNLISDISQLRELSSAFQPTKIENGLHEYIKSVYKET